MEDAAAVISAVSGVVAESSTLTGPMVCADNGSPRLQTANPALEISYIALGLFEVKEFAVLPHPTSGGTAAPQPAGLSRA